MNPASELPIMLALLAIQELDPPDVDALISWACAQGHDGPALRQLTEAAPLGWDLDYHLAADGAREAGLAVPDERNALLTLARDVMRRIVAREIEDRGFPRGELVLASLRGRQLPVIAYAFAEFVRERLAALG